MKQKVIQQGAEAKIILKGKIIIKDRIKKSYRLKELDEKIRKSRTKREAKILEKAFKLIPVPKIISTDNKEKIEMEFIPGLKLSENLDKIKNNIEVCKILGEQIAKLHDNNIIHGDLTTSNMILKAPTLYFIDFGLSYISSRIEDKAVDIHLIKEAFEAKHFENTSSFFKAVLEGYESSPNYKDMIQRLKKVESRGRYKQSY